MAHSSASSGLHFALKAAAEQTSPQFGPRLGTLVLTRPNGGEISLNTPALLTSTSRGVVPHLSRDHVRQTRAIGWVHVPFETFLEHIPPVPTLQPGPNAIHRFLGFKPESHLISMSIRDPDDMRDMPPNGNHRVSAYCLRGVRTISPAEWRTYVEKCQPDVVVALTDTPKSAPPFSRKRLTKSIERSVAWLSNLLAPDASQNDFPPTKPAIFVHLVGSNVEPARAAFSASLVEPLYDADSTAVGGLSSLDDGIAGYTFDLAPLRRAVTAADTVFYETSREKLALVEKTMSALVRTSLAPLPSTKPRLVHGLKGPHEILRLLRDVGVDVLEARWAVDAASKGVALDFVFPARGEEGAKKELAHNLYDGRYQMDFGMLSEEFIGELEARVEGKQVCPCIACSPALPPQRIVHGSDPSEAADAYSTAGGGDVEYNPPITRAYVHHLLHTHEMSAHTFLTAHNLEVVERFLEGVRVTITSGEGRFEEEVRRFEGVYNDEGVVFEEASKMWQEVELARGKGRLAREKQKETEAAGESL